MPAQGGGDHSDLEIGRAVVYMANRSGGNLPEPKARRRPRRRRWLKSSRRRSRSRRPRSPPPRCLPQRLRRRPPAPPWPAAPPLYSQACAACHAAGVAGAPKLNDKEPGRRAWPQGIDGLTASVIKGKGAMPPRGGSSASDAEIKAVVEYMVGTVK